MPDSLQWLFNCLPESYATGAALREACKMLGRHVPAVLGDPKPGLLGMTVDDLQRFGVCGLYIPRISRAPLLAPYFDVTTTPFAGGPVATPVLERGFEAGTPAKGSPRRRAHLFPPWLVLERHPVLSVDQLLKIMPNLRKQSAAELLPHINAAMAEFGIDATPIRAAAFIAQIAHESAELRYLQEIASGADYEGRKDLGNTQPGDGRRFKGRGPIQLTGRANYQEFGAALGLDLIADPVRAALPEVGFRIAGLFWKRKGLNELADAGNFREITRRINGGFNGLADRYKYYGRAKEVLV